MNPEKFENLVYFNDYLSVIFPESKIEEINESIQSVIESVAVSNERNDIYNHTTFIIQKYISKIILSKESLFSNSELVSSLQLFGSSKYSIASLLTDTQLKRIGYDPEKLKQHTVKGLLRLQKEPELQRKMKSLFNGTKEEKHLLDKFCAQEATTDEILQLLDCGDFDTILTLITLPTEWEQMENMYANVDIGRLNLKQRIVVAKLVHETYKCEYEQLTKIFGINVFLIYIDFVKFFYYFFDDNKYFEKYIGIIMFFYYYSVYCVDPEWAICSFLKRFEDDPKEIVDFITFAKNELDLDSRNQLRSNIEAIIKKNKIASPLDLSLICDNIIQPSTAKFVGGSVLGWMGTLPQNKWTEQEKDIFCEVFASHCTPSDPDLIKYLFWGTAKEGKDGWNFSKIVWDSDKNGNSKNKGLFVSFLSVLYEGRNIPNTRFIQDVFGVDTDRKRDKIKEVKRQLKNAGFPID